MLDPVTTLSIFQKQPDPKAFNAGDIIFTEGSPANHAYGILEGEVEISIDGKVVETVRAGEVFGAGALLERKDRNYTATAKTACKLAYLDRTRFLFAVQETPTFALSVMKSYSERLLRLASAAIVNQLGA